MSPDGSHRHAVSAAGPRGREARSISPGAASRGPGAVGSVSGNGRSVPRCARRAEPQPSAARVPNDAFTRAVPRRRLRRVVVRQRPRARFRRAAVASVAIRPHGQRECASPAPLATPRATARRLHEIPGGSPVAAWPQESTWQPPRRLLFRASIGFDVTHRARGGASARRHRDCGDNGTVRPFRRPRRRQPTTALWVAAPYHAVTRAARAIFLSIALPPLARRPLQPPVTTPFAPIRPPPPAG